MGEADSEAAARLIHSREFIFSVLIVSDSLHSNENDITTVIFKK